MFHPALGTPSGLRITSTGVPSPLGRNGNVPRLDYSSRITPLLPVDGDGRRAFVAPRAILRRFLGNTKNEKPKTNSFHLAGRQGRRPIRRGL